MSMPINYLKAVSWKDVKIKSGLWGDRVRLNRNVVLDYQYEQIEKTGRVDNFRRASGKKNGKFEGLFFNDSDTYKWIEAASYSLGLHPDKKLEERVNRLIEDIAGAQEEDGYLNTYFTLEKKEHFSDLAVKHELYCAGHLIEAAVAHHLATAKTNLLDVAIRFADLVCCTFDSGKKEGAPGHEEIELALVKLYHLRREKRYLDTARFFIEKRGQGYAGGDQYRQDHLPFTEQKEIVGHAVRAMYLMSGAADVFKETNDKPLMDTLKRLWENMRSAKMYVTGSIGSRHEGEAFGKNYELPNDRAYAETCAAIGNIFWNYRMLHLTGDAKYADVMEKVLYNGFLSGISLDGRKYFYQNPLQADKDHRRVSWFPCACCPPNVARLLSSLGGYLYSVSEQGVWLHLYGESEAAITLDKDRKVTLNQHTNYPWSGEINIRVSSGEETSFTLFVRIPGWCQEAEVLVNGKSITGDIMPSSYLPISRTWKGEDEVQLNISMPVEFLRSHPHSSNNARLAISRGPMIYCIETEDHPGIDVFDILLSPDTKLTPHFESGLLGGVVVLKGEASVQDLSSWRGKLYRPYRKEKKVKTKPLGITAIPYFAWANRSPGKMLVWF